MDFPGLGRLLKFYNVFLISGPVILTVGAVLLIRWALACRRASGGTGTSPRKSTLAGALIALLIGSVHLWGCYASVANAYRFRFDPRDVVELRVTRMTAEGNPAPDGSRTISDRPLIAEGLSRLASSDCWRRNHERLEDGYRIQIMIPGSPIATDRYVSVYRRSSHRGSLAVVVPHIGENHGGTVSHAGYYNCPAFLEWVARNLDPLFASH